MVAKASGPHLAKLVPGPGSKVIQKLEWKSTDVEIRTLKPSEKAPPSETKVLAIVEGRFRQPGWNLLKGLTQVITDNQGNFRLEIPIEEPDTSVELMAISPLGDIEKQVVKIVFPTYPQFAKELREGPAVKSGIGLSPGIALSFISYRESGIPGFTEFALTAKVSYSHSIFKPYLDIGANVFGTIYPFVLSPGTTGIWFLGANARFGYILPKPSEPWRLGIYVGYYYITTFVPGSQFGFKDMMGPQLFPTARYQFRNGSEISAYAKYSPVLNNLGAATGLFLGLTNCEVAFGLGYSHLLPNKHPIGVQADTAYLSLVVPGQQSAYVWSLSVGSTYGF